MILNSYVSLREGKHFGQVEFSQENPEFPLASSERIRTHPQGRISRF